VRNSGGRTVIERAAFAVRGPFLIHTDKFEKAFAENFFGNFGMARAAAVRLGVSLLAMGRRKEGARPRRWVGLSPKRTGRSAGRWWRGESCILRNPKADDARGLPLPLGVVGDELWFGL